MIDVVSIYAPRRSHPKFQDYRPFLKLQKASCRAFGLRQIVITDLEGAEELSEFNLFVSDMPGPLMKALTFGLWDYVAHGWERNTILTGADCLVASDPREVFDGGFDLGVTTHPFTDCILNTGAQFVADASKAEPFYRMAVEKCGEKWGDDQTAFADGLHPTLEHGDYLRGDARVRFLPVPGFNDAPEDEFDSAGMPVIAHFRGPRKKWMARWAERHLGIHD